jgi:hypothetical protein
MLTKEELQEWKAHPTTKAVFHRLKMYQQALTQECLEAGNLDKDQAWRLVVENKAKFDVIEDIFNTEAGNE